MLADDGTFWLNIGDSYTSGGRTWRGEDAKNKGRGMSYRAPTPEGLKPKDLIGVPWRIAFALQDDGWFLRTDIIWNKPNCQPESVKDRLTRRGGHRRSLLQSLSNELGLTCYLDNQWADQSGHYKIEKYYAVSIDSLPVRLIPAQHQFDVVLVDESEQVFSHLIAATKSFKISRTQSCTHHFLLAQNPIDQSGRMAGNS